MTRSRLVPFAPYIVVASLHLIGLFTGAGLLADLSKPALMPALLLALLLSRAAPFGATIILTSLALLFSWAGDVLLEIPGDIGFMLGLGSFFVAHVLYFVLFFRSLRTSRTPRVAVLLLIAWWAVLILVLAPHAGVLIVALAIYGIALAASTATALACNRFIAIGAVAFLSSDSILAFKFFYPGFDLVQADFLIMTLYCSAQGLIIFGVARELSAAKATRAQSTAADAEAEARLLTRFRGRSTGA